VSFSASATMAGIANSAVGSFSAGGANFTNDASIVTNSGTDGAHAYIGSKSGTRPAGHMGVLARGYKSTGALVCTTGYAYTGSASVGRGNACFFSGVKGSSYYSHGVTRAWNGSDYKSVYTFKTPYQTDV
jgi:hypothetical protein